MSLRSWSERADALKKKVRRKNPRSRFKLS